MGQKIDLTGMKFKRLLVISEAEPHISPSGRSYIMWNCLCDCGNTTRVRSSALTCKNPSLSCGCFSSESTRNRFRKHGMSFSREYTSYMAMKKRCYNSNDPHYHNYGGRGIIVCDRWLESFENFHQDMGDRPVGKTLDRIKNHLGYSPENCKWSTGSEQQLNRRSTGKTSKLRGVCWSTHYNCFIAQISMNGNNKFIGNFKSEYEAGLAYDNFITKNNLPNILNGCLLDNYRSRSDHKKENRLQEGGKKY